MIESNLLRAYQAAEAGGLNLPRGPLLRITLLTAAALLILGYHPHAEDGGLYEAGIKLLLNPSLYPHSLPFVEAPLHTSLFAPLMAATVRVTHLSLPVALLTAYFACLWLTLLGVWTLASRCYASANARNGAVLLAAAGLSLPIAGTSLMLADPYLTSRSITLPCTLFALAAVIDLSSRRYRAALPGAAALLIAALVHPLMAGYAIAATALLAITLLPTPAARRVARTIFLLAAVTLAATLHTLAPPESPAYLPIALSRYYWFLARWHWYELLGLAGPLLILGVVSRSRTASPTLRAVTESGVLLGTTAILIATLFAREHATTHLVARLQPLRVFLPLYLLMILVLGASLGERVLRSRPLPSLAALLFLGGIMFAAQRNTYPASAHIELPGTTSTNPWQQTFLWVRDHTPTDALFALDAHYIQSPQEDAQCFRAIAERSMLPDYSKDGGEAAIAPALTDAWSVGVQAQTRLNALSDSSRRNTLKPLGVDWLILDEATKTALPCPWHNARLQVCRLP